MKNPTDTPLSEHTQQTPVDAINIARSVLLAREALDFGAEHLSHDITERLRVARVRALAVASNQKTSHATQSSHSNFNFGQWFNRLSGGLRGGIAAGAVTIAFLLTFGTTQSDLDVLPNQANVVATAGKQHVRATLPEVQTTRAFTSNGVVNVQNKIKQASVPNSNATVAANVQISTVSSANPDDEQVDIVLREKIPLQAYLNDDFNQYADHQVMRANEQVIENNDPTLLR